MIQNLGKLREEIPDASGLVTTVVVNRKIGEVENKIPDFIGLVKKADYSNKIFDIFRKYFTTTEYDKCSGEIPEAKIKRIR